MSRDTNPQDLLDYHQVSQTLYRYGSRLDSRDHVTLRSLFVVDAIARNSERALLEGADDLVRWNDDVTEKRRWQHHFLSICPIEVTGQEAEPLTYYTSHQADRSDPHTVTVIVAHYRDRLRKLDGPWKFVRKQWDGGWTEEASRPASIQGRP